MDPRRIKSISPGVASWRAAALLVSALLLGSRAEAQRAGGAARPADVSPPGASPEVHTETIPGTVVGFRMVRVPAGRVTLATPDGPREVEVGPLWAGATEVTWDVYDVWVFGLDQGGQVGTGKGEDAVSRPSKPYLLPGESFGHQGRPALAMTYHAAEQFARWLSAKTGRAYRLPTEAEWEYLCRAGGEPDAPLATRAWYWENADDRTHAPATRAPNAFGLSDLLGNVAEWVWGADGRPVVKGGSFQDDAADVHCGARRAQSPAWNATDPQLPKSRWWLPDAPFVGFRLVRDP